MGYLIGIDGGGTRTTVALTGADGAEVVRRVGPPGLVDPRHPAATAHVLLALIREAMAEAGWTQRAAALCAGLAGVGHAAERDAVCAALADAGIADRVTVVSDGEIALEGALGDAPGILLIAGTGSVAYGRAEGGRVERCGGWGMVVGDEGSAYAVGRAALRAALCAYDRRGRPTRLLPAVLGHLGFDFPAELPPWAGRAEKADIAALAALVADLARSGDDVASDILGTAARDLAAHVAALAARLGPWAEPPPVVFFGGMFQADGFAERVERALGEAGLEVEVREPEEGAVGGAVRIARRLAAGEEAPGREATTRRRRPSA